jgi:hypothetical protein
MLMYKLNRPIISNIREFYHVIIYIVNFWGNWNVIGGLNLESCFHGIS